ncbi:MAG: putative sulfate exporter family transporter [Rikenellaceae bacterium]
MIAAYLIFGHLSLFVSPALALFMGIVMAMAVGNPFMDKTKKISKHLLQYCVVGLGFGMNLHESLAAGKEGMIFTVISVVSVMVVGVWLGKKLGVSRKGAYLISSGTAICGGSAIAAVAPVIDADESDTSLSLAVIFVLNAVALFIFPALGRLMEMTQEQFGVWAAIAIHDTSSVVGAGAAYGDEALKVATTVKLTRALWIIPLSLISAYLFKGSSGKKVQIPYFILFFIGAMILNTYVDLPAWFTSTVGVASHAGLSATLFLIGSGLTREVIKSAGIKPLAQAVILWVMISLISLVAVLWL